MNWAAIESKLAQHPDLQGTRIRIQVMPKEGKGTLWAYCTLTYITDGASQYSREASILVNTRDTDEGKQMEAVAHEVCHLTGDRVSPGEMLTYLGGNREGAYENTARRHTTPTGI